MGSFISTETLIIELLLVVSLVAIAVQRLRIPYTVALVVVGLLITFQQHVAIELTSELILGLLVPPLVFEAAFNLSLKQLRENGLVIGVYSVVGVLLTTAIIGALVSAGVGLTLTSGLVFGALMAATDPVAVIALFRSLGAPKQLVVLLEGESLFNDGTAIVVFNLLLGTALATAAGASAQQAIDLPAAVVDFIRVSAGGLAIGAGLGWLISLLIGRIDAYLTEITLTTVLALGAYLIAEQLHVSGVLAVVAAGIVCGTIGKRGMSPTTRIVLAHFWEYLAFLATSFVFLLIGLDVNVPDMLAHGMPIAIGVLAVVVSRAVVVYGLGALLNVQRRVLPLAYQHVMFWGGLRGAIGLALALSLPLNFGDRDLLRIMAFGVVLFTLLVQGTTMSPLLRRLGLIMREPVDLEYERRHARVMALRAGRDRVARLHALGVISAASWQRLEADLNNQIHHALDAQQQLLQEQPALREAEFDDARRENLRAQRAALASLLGHGIISELVYEELVGDIDRALGGTLEMDESDQADQAIELHDPAV